MLYCSEVYTFIFLQHLGCKFKLLAEAGLSVWIKVMVDVESIVECSYSCFSGQGSSGCSTATSH